MQHARNLLLSRPFLQRIPDQALIVSEAGAGTYHLQATRRCRRPLCPGLHPGYPSPPVSGGINRAGPFESLRRATGRLLVRPAHGPGPVIWCIRQAGPDEASRPREVGQTGCWSWTTRPADFPSLAAGHSSARIRNLHEGDDDAQPGVRCGYLDVSAVRRSLCHRRLRPAGKHARGDRARRRSRRYRGPRHQLSVRGRRRHASTRCAKRCSATGSRAQAITPHIYMREFQTGSFTNPDPACAARPSTSASRPSRSRRQLDADVCQVLAGPGRLRLPLPGRLRAPLGLLGRGRCARSRADATRHAVRHRVQAERAARPHVLQHRRPHAARHRGHGRGQRRHRARPGALLLRQRDAGRCAAPGVAPRQAGLASR